MAKNFQEKIKQLIMEKVDMTNLTAAQQNKIVLQLLDNISLKISLDVFEKLDEEARQKAIKFLKVEDKDVFLNYLNTKIKNLSELVERNISETIEEFKKLSET